MKHSSDEKFMEGAIHIVAQIGIENLRTKHVADYAGFSEATLFRAFRSKEDLLCRTFLFVDKRISELLTGSSFISGASSVPFDAAVEAVWHRVFRYLIDNRDETIFLIRFRYSSLYSEEIRSRREAYNGGFEAAYAVFEAHYGEASKSYRGFLINYIFEMTLCFAEKVLAGRIEDTRETEFRIWAAVSSAVKAITQQSG